MSQNTFCLSSLLALLGLSSLTAGIAIADDVETASLLERLPVLSADNEQLNGFQFIGEMSVPPGIPAVFEACWTRADGNGLALVDHLGFPILFTAEKQLMLYDASESAITLFDDSSANVVVKVENRRMTATCGACSSEDAKIIVDVPSFIPDAQSATRTLKSKIRRGHPS